MNQDSSMVVRQARDLEVRVRVPVQVQIFLLKFDNSGLCVIVLEEILPRNKKKSIGKFLCDSWELFSRIFVYLLQNKEVHQYNVYFLQDEVCMISGILPV